MDAFRTVALLRLFKSALATFAAAARLSPVKKRQMVTVKQFRP
jgi:hypothetical protein